MKASRFDISLRRFHPLWLIAGALIGRALGLVGGLNFSFWYFANPAALIGWQVFGAITGALFASFLMTSRVPLQTKGAVLGLGIGFAAAIYGGEIQSALRPSMGSRGLAGMPVGEGIFFEWAYMHLAFLGAVVGWIISAAIARKRRKAHLIAQQSTPGETAGTGLETEQV